MKKIHGNKVAVVFSMKWRALLSKNFVIMPLMGLAITILMRLLYGSMETGGEEEIAVYLQGLAMGMGAMMNTVMTGLFCTSAMLAEEKEKHTLRALMTSSVNGVEFFLGSLLPVVLLVVAVDVLIVLVAGVSPTPQGWLCWIVVSLLCTLASSILGMIFGICAKNQVTASTITTVPLLVLVLLPTFGNVNETVGKIADYLFTGVMSNTATALAMGEGAWSLTAFFVIIGEILLSAVAFLLVYRKNGYDHE